MRHPMIGLLGLVVASHACMRDTVGEQARPTEPAMTAVQATTPTGSANPSHGLLDAPADTPEEFGAVHWGRDLNAALALSETTGKPVLLLFTEVPGCSTVRGFANGPLRHPLLVEAIEDQFVPVVVRNNVGGEEREILKSFGEPSWNNPVVRFLDAERHDLVDRYAKGWTAEGLAASMIAALKAADRPVPGYLNGLHAELSAQTETTLFSMYCFWTGEVKLAGIEGVVATRPGFANGREVVEVTWDRRKTNAAKLMARAAKTQAASSVVVADAAQRDRASKYFDDVVVLRGAMKFSEKDDKYQIRQRPWGWVPMTPAQATAVNRAVTTGQPIDAILSPRQIAFAESDERFDRPSGPLKAPNH